MELDELKKSWNMLDEQLQKEPITDEKRIAELIDGYKTNARRSLGRLIGWQRISLAIGGLGLLILLTIWLSLPSFIHSETLQNKIATFLVFIAVSIIAGLWWDWKTYLWNKGTLVDEMPVAIVSKRMTTFRRWTKYEVIVGSIWVVLFNILNYWVMEYYLASFKTQIILISIFVIFDAAIIYLLYKRIMYKHINDIKKNIEELEDICTE